MKAIVKTKRAPGITVADVDKPVIGDSEMLVKVQSGSLCGSDIHVYEWTPGYEWISIPVILGHEFAGDVVEVGKNFDAAAVGDRVTVYPFLPCGSCPACRTGKGDYCEKRSLLGLSAEGGFAEYVRVGSTAKVFKIPDGMSYDAAALIEPLAVAMHAVDISDLKLGHKVAVLGPGPIGLFTLMSVRAGGAGFVMMTGTSEDEGRFKIAERLGADELVMVDKQDPVARVRELTGGGLDIVYEATGYHGAIQQALEMLKPGGTLVIVAIHSKPAEFNATTFVRGKKKIIASYAYEMDTWDRAMTMLAGGRLPVEEIVTHRMPFEKAEEGFELALKKKAVKVIFTP